MTDKKEIKKYCSGLDCLTCNEVEPCIYRIANKLQEQLERKEQECEKYKQALDEIGKIANNREVYCEHCNNDEDDFSCGDCGYCKTLDIINKAKNSK